MPKKNRQKRKDLKEEITADQIEYDPKFAKTQMQRMKIIQEVENKLYDNRLEGELATKILTTMLNDYLINGTRYIDKELSLDLRSDIPRKYIVNLYNDTRLMDQVYIKAKTQEEIEKDKARTIERLRRAGKHEEADSKEQNDANGKTKRTRKTADEILAEEFA